MCVAEEGDEELSAHSVTTVTSSLSLLGGLNSQGFSGHVFHYSSLLAAADVGGHQSPGAKLVQPSLSGQGGGWCSMQA